MAEMNTAQDGRAVINRTRALVRYDRIAFSTIAVVIQVDGERTVHPIHNEVGGAHIFDQTAPSAAGLNADAAVGADKDAIRDDDILDIAAHLAADHHAAMTAFQHAVGDGNIAAGAAALRQFVLGAGFDGDAVITDAHETGTLAYPRPRQVRWHTRARGSSALP